MQAGFDPAASAPQGATPTVVDAGAGDALTLPSASFIADGQFVRVGSDLSITDADGHEFIVQGYFAGDASPDLLSPDGAQLLTPGLVGSFMMPLAPGQYAQAAPTVSASPIGQVLDLNGEAFAVHADGTRIQLAKGDAVYEGDVVQTGGGDSAVRMVFTDKTEFSLGSDARLALDQLVFNPDTQSGSAQFSVLKGVFIFASGQIAKSDNTDMVVTTPVATIGIRGTEVAGRVADGDSQFTIIHGSIEVTTSAGSVTLDDSGETTQVAGNGTPPSDPLILTTAQFGQAYGSVAGVVSGYFSPGQPEAPGGAPGGDGVPSSPGDGSPDGSHSGPDDHADSGTAPGDIQLASTLPADSPTVAGVSDPVSLATTFAGDPAATTGEIGTSSPLSTTGVGFGDPLAGLNSTVAAVGNSGFAAASGPTLSDTHQAGTAPVEGVIVAPAPGLDLADSLTFAGTSGDGQAGGPSGFTLAPSGGVADVAGAGADAAVGPVQVAFIPVLGTVTSVGGAVSGDAENASTDSPPLDMPSSGGSGSPFRADSGSSNPFAANPYVSQPYGYAGPQLGDAVFTLVSNDPSDPDTGSISVGDDPFLVQGTTPAVNTADIPQASVDEPAEITLTVSNAATNEQVKYLTNSYELPNLGPDSFVLVGGSQTGLPGVSNSAEIALQRDGDGNVDVVLTSAWNSVKNIWADSDTAADIRIENFVHADVSFGNGGDSDITITGAKRGFITTGDGNDTITVDAVSNGPGLSHTFELNTGAGDDHVVFNGASDGLSVLHFNGGDGTDTLSLTGPGQRFDLTTGQIQISGVERIDISGTGGDASLTVPSTLLDGLADTVNPLTGTTQTLVVDGDAGDTLNLQGDGWSADNTTATEGYTIYHNHETGMNVAANTHVTVT
jgi:FecR protein